MLIAPIEIKCPKCGKRATFSDPFELSVRANSTLDLTEPHIHVWGGWIVKEKFPNVIPWEQPKCGLQRNCVGVVTCDHCALIGKHQLNWPDDAFFQWRHGRINLWACSREHAEVLGEYLGSLLRDESKFGKYARSLTRLPKDVILAKHRDQVVRIIKRSLQDEKV